MNNLFVVLSVILILCTIKRENKSNRKVDVITQMDFPLGQIRPLFSKCHRELIATLKCTH